MKNHAPNHPNETPRPLRFDSAVQNQVDPHLVHLKRSWDNAQGVPVAEHLRQFAMEYEDYVKRVEVTLTPSRAFSSLPYDGTYNAEVLKEDMRAHACLRAETDIRLQWVSELKAYILERWGFDVECFDEKTRAKAQRWTFLELEHYRWTLQLWWVWWQELKALAWLQGYLGNPVFSPFYAPPFVDVFYEWRREFRVWFSWKRLWDVRLRDWFPDNVVPLLVESRLNNTLLGKKGLRKKELEPDLPGMIFEALANGDAVPISTILSRTVDIAEAEKRQGYSKSGATDEMFPILSLDNPNEQGATLLDTLVSPPVSLSNIMQIRSLMEEGIPGLTGAETEVLLCDAFGFTDAEGAAKLGVTLPSYKAALNRARKKRDNANEAA